MGVIIHGSIIGVIEGDTRSLDHGSHASDISYTGFCIGGDGWDP